MAERKFQSHKCCWCLAEHVGKRGASRQLLPSVWRIQGALCGCSGRGLTATFITCQGPKEKCATAWDSQFQAPVQPRASWGQPENLLTPASVEIHPGVCPACVGVSPPLPLPQFQREQPVGDQDLENRAYLAPSEAQLCQALTTKNQSSSNR